MRSLEEYPDILDVKMLSEMLNIGTALAYRLVKEGKFKAKKIGRDYKILKTAVIEYLNGEGD